MRINAEISSLLDCLIEEISIREWKVEQKRWRDACYEMKEMLKSADLTTGNEICKRITELLPVNSNLLFDVGKNLTYGGQSSVIKKETKVYMSAGLGTMGYAIPAAIGTMYGNANPTYAITGDGGAQMNIQELNTIIKNELPIKIIVLNNKALGNIRIFQEQYLDARFVATSEKEGDYFSCDFKALAEAYGIKAYRLFINELERYEDELNSGEAALFEILYEDCPALPGIVAGGEFLKEGSGIEKTVIEKIRLLMEEV